MLYVNQSTSIYTLYSIKNESQGKKGSLVKFHYKTMIKYTFKGLLHLFGLNYTVLFTIAGLTLYGAYLRFFQLSAQSYWMDEGYTTLAVMNSLLPSGNTYYCGIYCALTSPVVSLLGMDEFSMRFIAVLAGTLLIPVVFLLTRRLFSQNIALLASAFTALSYWQIAWSRQARWYTLLALFFWSALYFYHRALYDKTHKTQFFLLALACTALAILTHPLGLLLPVILCVWIIAEPTARKMMFGLLSTMSARHKIIFAIFVVILAIWVGSKLASLASIISFSCVFPYYLVFYLKQYWFFILFLIPVFVIHPKEHTRPLQLLLFVFLIYFIPLSFLSTTIQYRYLFHVTPVLLILGSAGIIYVYGLLPSRALRIFFVTLASLCFFVAYTIPNSGGVLVPNSEYFLESDSVNDLKDRVYYSYTPQPDWRLAYKTIIDKRNLNDIVISSHPHFTYIYAGESGYWFPINYEKGDTILDTQRSGNDWYVGAKPIPTLDALMATVATQHGFIVFDSQARDGRIPDDILDFIDDNLKLELYHATNKYSKIWVYSF